MITDGIARGSRSSSPLIRGKDDALVIVGAGHLVGKDGVVELLRAKGYTIEQL